MTTETPQTYNIENYPKYSSNIFEVENYTGISNEIDTGGEDVKSTDDSCSKDLSELRSVDIEKEECIQEADDIVPELDIHELEKRQREANEETTRSEDLRQFLNEMHETLGKSPKAQQLEMSAGGQGLRAALAHNSNPGSPGGCGDTSLYKQNMTTVYQGADLEAMAAETAPIGPPDGGWAWFIVLASFFCMITIDGTCFNYGLLVPDMMQDYGGSKVSAYMWPGSIISGFYMTLGPLASALSNQFNFRPVAMAGGLISGVAILLSAFMNNIYAFIFLFGFCGGVGFSLIYLPAIAVVGHWFHEKRPIAVGMALCGSGFGTLVFGQCIPWLIQQLTWKGTVILIAGVCIQSLVFISLFRPLELHLRMQQFSKILQTIRQMQKEDHECKRLEHEKMLEEQRRKKKADKEQLRHQQRMKNKRIVIYRGSIMQKIIEEKKRQRTVSMGSLDGMVITRDNELVKVAMSSIDIYEKPILSVNAINRIRESVVKRLENKIKKKGPGGVINIGDSRSTMGTCTNISSVQLKNSLPQLVQDYINSQVSLQTGAGLSGCQNGQSSIGVSGLQRQSSIQGSINRNMGDDTTSIATPSVSTGLQLEEKAKAVIQASLRKEMTRPFYQKELLFSGSIRHLNQPESDMDKRSQTSFNMSGQSVHSHQSGGTIHAPGGGSTVGMVTGVGNPDENHGGDEFVMDDAAEMEDGFEMEEPDNEANDGADSGDGPGGALGRFIRELLDLSLLTSPTFLLMVISSITAMLGIFVPFFLLPVYLNSLGTDLIVAGQLISYVGVANTAGRLISTVYIEKAWSSSHKLADCLWINNFALLMAGVAAGSIPLLVEYYPLLIIVLVLYGLCVAAFVSLKSILVVELLGLNRLTNSFSFLLIFQGLATVFGAPLAGMLCDSLEESQYKVAFYFTGVAIIISGLLCFPLRAVARYERGGDMDELGSPTMQQQLQNQLQQNQAHRYSSVTADDLPSELGHLSEPRDLELEPTSADGWTAEVGGDTSVTINEDPVSRDVTKQPEMYEVAEDQALEPLVEEEEEECQSEKRMAGRNEIFQVTRVDEN